jgi:hypothetical protein
VKGHLGSGHGLSVWDIRNQGPSIEEVDIPTHFIVLYIPRHETSERK